VSIQVYYAFYGISNTNTTAYEFLRRPTIGLIGAMPGLNSSPAYAAIVDEDRTGNFSKVGKKLLFIGGLDSLFLSMPYLLLIEKADSFKFAPPPEKLLY